METPNRAHPHAQNGISWEADDFYYHPKDFSWYLLAILASIPIALVPWLLSGRSDYLTPGIILIALFGLIIYAGRKPQRKHFELNSSRLKIESQSFDLLSFSSYWVEVFDTHTQVTFIAVKRTTMPISLCLTDKQTIKKILDILQTSIPQTNPSQNPADWLMRKIKF